MMNERSERGAFFPRVLMSSRPSRSLCFAMIPCRRLGNKWCQEVPTTGRRIYVGDQAAGTVTILERGVAVGHLGKGAGEFLVPNAIAVTGDGIAYVVDSRAKEVRVYDYRGKLQGAFGSSLEGGRLGFPTDIATGWGASSHATSTATALSADACLACHGGGDPTRTGLTSEQNAHGSSLPKLLSPTVNSVSIANTEEALCYACHRSAGPGANIQDQLAKGSNGADIYHHPVVDAQQTGGRAVECTSCHDPHQAKASNKLYGVTGVDLAGAAIPAGTNVEEYEVCFKCHSDGFNSARARTTNKRTDFATTNSAYHPVVQAGRNTSSNMAAQLIGGLTVSSTITCADCHNNEATSDVSGPASGSTAGPKGPHGSTNPFILRAFYWTNPTGRGSYQGGDYALCFLCHDEAKLVLNDTYGNGARTNFEGSGDNFHWKHVNKWSSEQIGCTNCHYNTHGNQNVATTSWVINGVEYTTPPQGYKTRGVSFSPEVLAFGYSRPAFYIDTSTRQRRCYVDCHGKEHDGSGDFRYTPPSGDDDPLTY